MLMAFKDWDENQILCETQEARAGNPHTICGLISF